jgi:hypothetical protein
VWNEDSVPKLCSESTFYDFLIFGYSIDSLQQQYKREEEREKKEMKMKKVKKFAWIGAASVGGGVLVGLTGGLVAPLVAGSLAALLGII